jgi:hypothetical protein
MPSEACLWWIACTTRDKQLHALENYNSASSLRLPFVTRRTTAKNYEAATHTVLHVSRCSFIPPHVVYTKQN